MNCNNPHFILPDKLKQPLVVLLLLLSFAGAHAQTKEITKVDTETYGLYKQGKWDELISSGESAIENQIDFYYLRMRIAYANFVLGRYRKAIPHYQRALELKPKDITAQKFLMLCYEYGGRKHDALKLSGKIDSLSLPGIAQRYHKGLYSAGVIYSYQSTNSNTTRNKITAGKDLNTNGVQKATNHFNDVYTFFSHRLGRSIIAHHGLEYLNKNDFSYYISDGSESVETDQTLHQWNYGLKLQITPWHGTSIMPGVNFVSYKIPSASTSYSDIEESTTLYNIKVDQDFSIFKAGLSYFGGELNSIDTKQYGAHFTLYPKANLNLYYTFDGYMHQQKHKDNKDDAFVHKHTIGTKIANFWWLEGSALFPEVINFYDFGNGGLYNSLEGTKKIFNLTNIFIVKNSKLSFLAGAAMNTGVSKFVLSDAPITKTSDINYNRITFTGGIVWKL